MRCRYGFRQSFVQATNLRLPLTEAPVPRLSQLQASTGCSICPGRVALDRMAAPHHPAVPRCPLPLAQIHTDGASDVLYRLLTRFGKGQRQFVTHPIVGRP